MDISSETMPISAASRLPDLDDSEIGGKYLPPSQKLPDFYEVVNGEIVEVAPMGARQATLASHLQGFLWSFAVPKKLGQPVTETLFHLADNLPERRPDVAYVSAARWPFDLMVPESNSWAVVPDLAVEVISPTNTYNEIRKKIRDYFQAGVLIVWVISTDLLEVEVFTPSNGYRLVTIDDILKGDPVLPGFEFPLRDLFSKRFS